MFWRERASLALMPSNLARELEGCSIVRSRVRKGNAWVRVETTEDGEQVIGVKSLEWNAPILSILLDHYGLQMQLIPELTKRVSFCYQLIEFFQKILDDRPMHGSWKNSWGLCVPKGFSGFGCSYGFVNWAIAPTTFT